MAVWEQIATLVALVAACFLAYRAMTAGSRSGHTCDRPPQAADSAAPLVQLTRPTEKESGAGR